MKTNYNLTEQDLKDQCISHMTENGFILDEPIIADGKIHRFSKDEKRTKQDEWYISHYGSSVSGNPYLVCNYGSWSTGEKYTFKSWSKNINFNIQQRREFAEILKKNQEDASAQIQKEYDSAAMKARKIWAEAQKTPPENHVDEYLKYPNDKGIYPTGVKFWSYLDKYPCIILAWRNINGEIRTLQFIYTDSDGKTSKRWLLGGEKKGNFHTIPSEFNPDGEINATCEIYIVEGWATGKSVQMALESEQHNNFVVVVAGDKGNIAPVIENIRNKNPNIRITIAADNDPVGKSAAIDAANRFGCHVTLPIFAEDRLYASNDPEKKLYTDFNDLHSACGLEEVKKQLKNIIVLPSQKDDLKCIATNLLKREDPFSSFSLDSLPEVLRNHVKSICETTSAHPIMITSSVLTTISAFMGKRFCIPEGDFYQTLYPNLWILCIAGSGQFKTTALNKGAKFAYEKYNEIEKEIRRLDSEIKKIPNSDLTQKRELEEARQQLSLQNILLPNKTTTEGLLEYLSQGHNGAIFQSEFAEWLQGFEKNGNNDLKSIFTVLFDVPPLYRYKTKNNGDHVLQEPCISICAVSTLDWLKRDLKPDDTTSGFFARFLLFTPPQDKSEIPPALPTKKPNTISQAEIMFKNKLIEIDELSDTWFYTISESAKETYSTMCRNIYEMADTYDDKCKMILEPYIKRWCPGLLKLAIIMQFFENSESKQIGENALIAAMSILILAIKSTANLFEGELGESEHQRKCRILLDWICQKVQKTGTPVLRKDILASKKLNGGVTEYDYILNTLTESGKIKFVEKNPKNTSEYSPQNDSVELK